MLANRFLDGAKDLPPRKRWVALAVVVVLVMAGALVALGWDLVSDTWTAKPRAEAQRDADRGIDLAKTPFTSTADYDTSLPEFWKIVLDRTLTEDEQAALEAIPLDGAGKKVWEFLRPLGGRLLRYPTSMLQPPPNFDSGEAFWADATIFNMNLFSERTSQLSIVDMRAINVSCRPPSAKTVVEFPPQGEAEYPGVLFDLTTKDTAPFITDPGDDQGQPYFSRRKIDLGGGTSPGALRVEAMVRGQSCQWEIQARYRDSIGNGSEVTLRDGDKPFFAEALPAKPEQYWVVDFLPSGSSYLSPCHEASTAIMCTHRAKANG
ncbi:hypothetical protein ACIA5D_46130 [Actinoplanes sp. NPDC051513]|uniref:hypothetical protein n=1 Tax=Actinoplanes sp. NPDC051513 TaxID=3363908 RepID=UPI00378FFD2C